MAAAAMPVGPFPVDIPDSPASLIMCSLSTDISWKNKDSYGKSIPTRNRAQLYRLSDAMYTAAAATPVGSLPDVKSLSIAIFRISSALFLASIDSLSFEQNLFT